MAHCIWSANTLILSGGGAKSVACIGSLNILHENGILDNINRYAGTSAGAILCVFLNIGFTPNEIEKAMFTQNSSMVSDSFYTIPINLIFSYGLFTGNKIINYIKSLLKKKGFDENITFNQLYIKTNKILVLTGTSLSIRDTFYFNNFTSPDMKVIDALRISISIPFYFTCVNYTIENKVHTFVDGGILQNFPMYYFKICDLLDKYIYTSKELHISKRDFQNQDISLKCEKSIGIMLISDDDEIDVNDFYKGYNSIVNISSYILELMNTMLNKIEQDNFVNPITGSKNDFFENVICIKIPNNVSAINFNLSKEIKNQLIHSGQDSAKKLLNISNN